VIDINKNTNDKWMGHTRHIHFVGIGGAGMSGIAEVLCDLGYRVTGSDVTNSTIVQRLCKLGIPVGIGHARQNINGADVVVVSSAIRDDNEEVIHAYQQHIPVIPRAEMLAELMRFRHGIAVAGTHGKTTVTSLIASLLTEAGLDPTFIIGGRLNHANTHAHLGLGDYLVAEADESDKSFLYLNPVMAVVTNVDADHMDTYDGDLNCLRETFVTFLRRLPFYGLAVVCIDDPTVNDLLGKISRPVVTFGFHSDADFRASRLQQDGVYTTFRVFRPAGKPSLNITLNLPGKHNALNALAAIVVSDKLGVSDGIIKRGLADFQGIARRFQVFGDVLIGRSRVLIIDDYGHHPNEIAVTLDAIRAGWPTRRLIVAFQPHRYTRTRDLFNDFVHVLSKSDVLLLLDIFPAGESPLPGITGRGLYQAIYDFGHLKPLFVKNVSGLVDTLPNVVKDGDIVLTLGAGNIGAAPSRLVSS